MAGVPDGQTPVLTERANDTARRLISVREAAARGGIARDWAYELARLGQLPGLVKRGPRRLYVVTSIFDAALARGWPAESTTSPVSEAGHQP